MEGMIVESTGITPLHFPLKKGNHPLPQEGELLLWLVRFYDVWGSYFLGIQLSNVDRGPHGIFPSFTKADKEVN